MRQIIRNIIKSIILEDETPSGKMYSASSRFRPYETVVFDKPIVGKNGNQLVSYQWSYEWTMEQDMRSGDMVSKRISDWTQAESSADTGRDIVHKFWVLRTDGTSVMASSESVPILLGYVDRAEMKNLPSIVSSVKTLAKQRMQLAILTAQQQEFEEAQKVIKSMVKPEVEFVEYREGQHGGTTIWKMGEQRVWQHDEAVYNRALEKSEYLRPTKISQERMETLEDLWERKRMDDMGVKNVSGQIYDLKRRIERQQRKVEQATNSHITIK